MWLVDLERALALLVGQTLGALLAGPPVSREEKVCEKWLNSPLLGNGLEERDPERGWLTSDFIVVALLFFAHWISV